MVNYYFMAVISHFLIPAQVEGRRRRVSCFRDTPSSSAAFKSQTIVSHGEFREGSDSKVRYSSGVALWVGGMDTIRGNWVSILFGENLLAHCCCGHRQYNMTGMRQRTMMTLMMMILYRTYVSDFIRLVDNNATWLPYSSVWNGVTFAESLYQFISGSIM